MDSEIAYTAMCMWEHVLDAKQSDFSIKAFFETMGTCEARQQVLNLAPQLEAAWEKAEDEWETTFDWDFVPKWMDKHLVWTPTQIEFQ